MGKELTIGSAFAGIGGFDLGFERAGWKCRWQIEIDAACNRVLQRHWPDVERKGDIRRVKGAELEEVDLICGGFPCQDVSVAGKRKGLKGERSGLFFGFAGLLQELRPAWCLIENVPGLLTSNRGADFLVVLDELGKCGYGVAWRILDSQFFGVPQKRRRVFIAGCLGRPCPPEILFEPEGVSGDSPKGGKAGKEVAYCLRGRPSHSGDKGDGGLNTTLVIKGAAISRKPSAGPQWGEILEDGTCYTLNATEVHAVAHTLEGDTPGHRWREEGLIITTKRTGVGVRRLTPLECERLQGFPDGWTEGESDSARYRMLGNAVTVNVAEWIARRIQKCLKHHRN